jgi:hypothetical protein
MQVSSIKAVQTSLMNEYAKWFRTSGISGTGKTDHHLISINISSFQTAQIPPKKSPFEVEPTPIRGGFSPDCWNIFGWVIGYDQIRNLGAKQQKRTIRVTRIGSFRFLI